MTERRAFAWGFCLTALFLAGTCFACTSAQLTGTFRVSYFAGWAYNIHEIPSGGFDDWQGPMPPPWQEPAGFPWGWLLAGVGVLGALALLARYGLLKATCMLPVRAAGAIVRKVRARG